MIRHAGGIGLQLATLLTLAAVASPHSWAEAFQSNTAEEKEFEEIRKSSSDFKVWTQAAQGMLGRFGYGVGPFDGRLTDQTRSALRRYQKANRIEPTGDLDFRTWNLLTSDLEATESPVYIPRALALLDYWDDWATVSGIWIEQGTQEESRTIPKTFSFAHFRCEKRLKVCIESIANMHGANLTSVETNLHEIARWDKYEIVTEPYDVPLCVRYITRVNRTTKQVTRNRYPKSVNSGCEMLEKREMIFTLIDGHKAWARSLEKHSEDMKRIVLSETN